MGPAKIWFQLIRASSNGLSRLHNSRRRNLQNDLSSSDLSSLEKWIVEAHPRTTKSCWSWLEQKLVRKTGCKVPWALTVFTSAIWWLVDSSEKVCSTTEGQTRWTKPGVVVKLSPCTLWRQWQPSSSIVCLRGQFILDWEMEENSVAPSMMAGRRTTALCCWQQLILRVHTSSCQFFLGIRSMQLFHWDMMAHASLCTMSWTLFLLAQQLLYIVSIVWADCCGQLQDPLIWNHSAAHQTSFCLANQCRQPCIVKGSNVCCTKCSSPTQACKTCLFVLEFRTSLPTISIWSLVLIFFCILRLAPRSNSQKCIQWGNLEGCAASQTDDTSCKQCLQKMHNFCKCQKHNDFPPCFASVRRSFDPIGISPRRWDNVLLLDKVGGEFNRIETTLQYSGMIGGSLRPRTWLYGRIEWSIGEAVKEMPFSLAIAVKTWAYAWHIPIGYSASLAVLNSLFSSNPHGSCWWSSLSPGHILAKALKRLSLTRKHVRLRLTSPNAQDSQSTKRPISTSLEKQGISHIHDPVGFSTAKIWFEQSRSTQKSLVFLCNKFAASNAFQNSPCQPLKTFNIVLITQGRRSPLHGDVASLRRRTAGRGKMPRQNKHIILQIM